jgi:hypothetical protein
MSITVCISANCCSSISYPESGYLWVILNWALGLRSLGCKVIWLEGFSPSTSVHEIKTSVAALKIRLELYGLAECVAICSWTDGRLPQGAGEGCLDLEAAAEANLLLNFHYDIPSTVVGRFRQSALVDIDPGILQIWMSNAGLQHIARHDIYFTIGETVGQPGARFPDAGLKWQYTPPCVALDWWPVHPAAEDATFTTISRWWGDWIEEAGESYPNYKRIGFLPFLDLPLLASRPLELALGYVGVEAEWEMLRERGWRVRDAQTIASTPWDYQRYIQNSLGEFSCVKPSCVRQQNAWISDRTLCYLASGKPAVVQHTGPSRFLPDAAGLFRFCDLEEAVRCLEAVMTDYQRQCQLARALAEKYFDARKVVRQVLERALT